jgi:hypothetical protein
MKLKLSTFYFLFCLFLGGSKIATAQAQVSSLFDFEGQNCEGAVSFVANGKAYVGLGQTGPNQYTKAFYLYDPIKDKWNLVAPFPAEGRAYAIAFVADNKAYVGFGERIDATLNKVNRVYADLYEYDPAADSWSPFDKGSLSAMVGLGQASVFTLIENGKTIAHITGGRNTIGTQNAWYSYSPSTHQWTFPVNNQVELKRYGAAAVTVNNKGYIMGGKDDVKTFDNVLQYDPTASSIKLGIFATLAALSKSNATAIANANNIYLAYGNKSNFIQFNPLTKKTTDLGDILKLKSTRKGMISFLYQNKIFIGLGRAADESLNTDLYTIGGLTTATNDKNIPASSISLYPNPAQQQATLIFENELNEAKTIVLRDILGRVLQTYDTDKNTLTLEINSYDSGVYLLEIAGNKMQKKEQLLLVKQK